MKKYIKINSENCAVTIFFITAFVMPIFVSTYTMTMFSYYYITAILVISISLAWGYCGILSYGSAAFYGVGAYVYAILSLSSGNATLTPLYFLISIVLVTIFAGIIGYFMFYGGINPIFVALITLCVSLALETFLAQTAGSHWAIMGVPLGGYNGITNIPSLYIGSYKLENTVLYLLILFILLIIYIVLRYIKTKKIGYTLIAIRENKERSQLFGYNIEFIQMIVFAISGAIAATAGVLYTAWGGYITPSAMGIIQATIPIVIVAAGGRKNVTASLIFAVFYAWFTQTLSASGSEYANIILGIILLIAILFVPNGFIASIFDAIDKAVSNLIGIKNHNNSTKGVIK